MSFESRMGAMLRRQESVRRQRDRFVIVGMVFVVFAGALAIAGLRSDAPQLIWQVTGVVVAVCCLWCAWRCFRVGITLTRLYNDPRRLSEMESLEALPSLRSAILPFLSD